MSEVRLMTWRPFTISLVLVACAVLAQGSSPSGGEDRGYDEGGLQSDAARSSSLSDAGGSEDVAAAAARGRASACSLVQYPGKASNKKAETFKSAESATTAF